MSASGDGWVPSAADRRSWASRLGDRQLHDRLLAELPCLRTPQTREPPDGGASLSGWVRVAAWNVQRGRHIAELTALAARCGADIWLLCEADQGMARTDNRHVTAELASRLGAGFAYGVEFVELGLGDAAERAAARGDNECGLHGNAIVSVAAISDAEVVRLDQGGEWFEADSAEPRVGTRMATVGTVVIDGQPLHVGSVHLESGSDPTHRAAQLEELLAQIDRRGGGDRAVIGGDLNTFGVPWLDLAAQPRMRDLRRTEPARFSWPTNHEPLFAVAADHGYEWIDANVAAPTTRHGPDGTPAHVPMKLDWLLVRGLRVGRPAVVAATGTSGQPLSDHEIVTVSVRV